MAYQRYELECDEPQYLTFPGLDLLLTINFFGLHQHSTSDHLHPRNMYTRLPHGFVSINRLQLHNQETVRQLIDKELRQWPLSDDHRLEVVEIALLITCESLNRMPSGCNFIELRFEASLFDDDDEEFEDESMDVDGGGVDNYMVPATESSIENLERKKAELAGAVCPVCMDDFPLDCEVARMPCSHDFHGDCIEEWLRTSHYCPVCRFKMPTT